MSGPSPPGPRRVAVPPAEGLPGRMRGPIAILIAVLTAGALAAPAQTLAPPAPRPSFSAPAGPKYRPNTLLVRFRKGTAAASMASAHAAVAATVVRSFHLVSGLQRVELPESTSVARALRAYRHNPNVLYAEPDFRVQAVAPVIPNDPQFPSQWDLNNTGQNGGTVGADISAEAAWGITTGDSSVFVGVIDTGVDYNHPDLSANMWTASFSFTESGLTCPVGSRGYNPVYGTCDPMDDFGHGTHVAGTIGASGNNGIGVAGINWNVTIIPCKFLDSSGSGYDSDAITCLEFFQDLKDNHGINLVATSNSWGGGGFSQALSDAIDAQRQSGILFIAAAGNAGYDNDLGGFFPADYYLPNLIAVAATDSNDAIANFSDFGKRTVHLGAPGVATLSTVPTTPMPIFDPSGYKLLSGTSMATPHVTGVAALLKAQDPSRDWRAIKNLILAGGDDKPSMADTTITGKRLNAVGAMTCSDSELLRRLLPVGDSPSAALGSPVELAVLHINCAAPAGDVTVTVNPGGTVLTLKDDGVPPDQAAGDGIYTGQFTPSSPGQYTVSIVGGETYNLEVLAPYFYHPTTFHYRDITSTGTDLNFTDDEVAQITPGFPIPFGGGSFNSLWVSNNGTVSFDTPFTSYVNFPLPPPASVGVTTLVSPFWTDLVSPNASQNVFWAVTGPAPDRELVIEWRNVIQYSSCTNNEMVTFQVVFFESKTDILFNYADPFFGGCASIADAGNNSTIGVQMSPAWWDEFSFNAPTLDYETALLWTTTGPDVQNPTPVLDSLSPSGVTPGSPGFTLTVNGSGFIDGVYSSVVRFNGVDRPTTFISSNQLTASIPASDVQMPTTVGVSVFTFDAASPSPLPFSVASPDFMLSSVSLIDSYVGQTTDFPVLAAAMGPYNSPVNLSCTPGGSAPPSTCLPSPNPVIPTVAGTAVTVSVSGAVGQYFFNLHGVGTDSNTTTHDVAITLHILDFNLASFSTTTPTIPHGTAQDVTFQVTAAGSFAGSVTLSCSGLPVGMSCGFSPSATVHPTSGVPANVTLTISTLAGLAPNIYPINVVGTPGSPSGPAKQQAVSVTVTTNPDFALASAASLVSRIGQTGVAGTASITYLDGYNKSVNLSCSVNTAGPSCGVTPNSVSASNASLSVSVDAGAGAAGNYQITMTGSDGILSHQITIPYAIWDYAVQAPVGAYPIPGTVHNIGFKLHPLNGQQNVDASCSVSGIAGASCAIVGGSNPISLAGGDVSLSAALTFPAGPNPCNAGAPCSVTIHTVDHDVPATAAHDAVVNIYPATTASNDFDGDGRADILWQNSTTHDVVVWLMSGATKLSAAFVATGVDPNWKAVGEGDFDGDGKADVLWQNSATGGVVVWLMNGAQKTGAAFVATGVDPAWKIVGVADFNGDGMTDILWRNTTTGGVVVWTMNGASKTSAAFIVPALAANFQIVGVGDFDGDGKADILVRDTTSGDLRLWLMNGATRLSDNLVEAAVDLHLQVLGVGDLYGDGKVAIVWRNSQTNDVVVWRMNGVTVVSKTTAVANVDPNWQIYGISDFDGDGKADLLWRNDSTTSVVVWTMNGATKVGAAFVSTSVDPAWKIVPFTHQ